MSEISSPTSAEKKSSMESIEREPIIGKYSDMLFGDPSIHAHVDAPHAQPITLEEIPPVVHSVNIKPDLGVDASEEQIATLIYTGSFKGRSRNLKPASKTIYANEKLRRILLTETVAEAVPEEGEVKMKIGGRIVTYTVKDGRTALDGSKPAIIVKQEHKNEVAKIIKKKAEEGSKPAPKTIYANKRMRRLLFGLEDWQTVPKSGTVKLKIDGQTLVYQVKNGRTALDGSKPSVIVRPEHKDEVVKIIKKRAASDARTGQIAQKINEMGLTVIIGKVNRHVVDINRYRNYKKCGLGELDPEGQNIAVAEYRSFKKKSLEHTGNIDENDQAKVPHLHIALHGKKNLDPEKPRDCDIEIGTVNGQSCDPDTRDWFEERLNVLLGEHDVTVREGQSPKILKDTRLHGHISKNMGTKRHGDNYKTIQLEVCKEIRYKYGDQLATILYTIAKEFDKKYAQPALQSKKEADVQKDVKEAVEKAVEPAVEPEVATGAEPEAETSAEPSAEPFAKPEVELSGKSKAETEGQPESVVELPKFKLTVRKAFESMINKNQIALSPAVADKLGVTDGSLVSTVIGERSAYYLEVVVYENLHDNVILMDKITRDSLGVRDGDEQEFDFGVH